jgi:hypothetical protein
MFQDKAQTVRGVAPLGKDRAITCEARLAVNHFPTR